MDLRLSFLLSAAIVFVGTHVILSHQLRRPLMKLLGQMGFVAVYSVIAVVTLGWTVYAFGEAPRGPFWWPPHDLWAWIATMVLTFFALLLIVGGVVGNPAAPGPSGEELAATRDATGIYAVTRHPVMWSIALWAISHILLAPEPRTLMLMGAFVVLALGGSAMQDHKKAHAMGKAWATWRGKTSFIPNPAGLSQVRALNWAIALVLWLAISWLHMPLGGIAAGVFKWVG